tara:strand:+ start:221 stop:895 length:675 start_codon:yes stop_codon:yes gene_type:complete
MEYIRKGHGLNTDTNKYCTECKEVKSREEYYKNKARHDGIGTLCKPCENAKKKAYSQTAEGKKRANEYAAIWREENKEKCLKAAKRFREKNREKIKERRNSPEGKKYARDYMSKRRNTDPVFKVRGNVSRMILHGLKGNHKTNSCFDALPYTPTQLVEHLERQFDDAMTWDNYGSYWHVDHIYPQSKLLYDSLDHPNFLKCWSLDNLQPLEAIENMKKGNKTID